VPLSCRTAEDNLINCPDNNSNYIVIAAKSARMLAQAGRNAGMQPLVIDLWGDQDTRLYAEDIQLIPSMDEAYFRPALEYFISKYLATHAVYGSGFEQHPASLKFMQERLVLLGNHPQVFDRLQDKPAFFSLLEHLGIPYPEVSFHTPKHEASWLVKPTQGQGGVGIRRHRCNEKTGQSSYWQKFQEGELLSVLFLADGKRSQIVGFNQQWTISLNEKDEFIFSGIINSTGVTDQQKQQITGWVRQLVLCLSLKGLNSLDFIQHGQQTYVLEINPRPPASMQLYDANLFARHIKACQGELLDFQLSQTGFSAYQIIYAQQDTKIPDGFEWPKNVVDIPIVDSIISKGQPICSIIASGKGPNEVLGQLHKMQRLITKQLERFQIHGI
jgi:uncharacterized protein